MDIVSNTFHVYIKATVRADGTVGYGMMWPDYPELTEGGDWDEPDADVATVEYQLIGRVKKQAAAVDPGHHHDVLVFCTNPSLYVCLDPQRTINFAVHNEDDPYSDTVMEMACIQD
jgi:hypothetical protein